MTLLLAVIIDLAWPNIFSKYCYCSYFYFEFFITLIYLQKIKKKKPAPKVFNSHTARTDLWVFTRIISFSLKWMSYQQSISTLVANTKKGCNHPIFATALQSIRDSNRFHLFLQRHFFCLMYTKWEMKKQGIFPEIRNKKFKILTILSFEFEHNLKSIVLAFKKCTCILLLQVQLG